jgi:hypothetical protein
MSHQILCEQCNTPVNPNEYGSYCELHRLNVDGCCRNHCIVESGEGEFHCKHCDLSYPHMIVKTITEIIDITTNKRICRDFEDLLEYFNTLYPPEAWARFLIITITNSIDIDWNDNFTLENNMDEFIYMVAVTLNGSGTREEDFQDTK